MMRIHAKIFPLVTILALMLSAMPAFSVDDDSTPYMPYPEPAQTQPKPAPKKAPAKKPAPKKTPAKKPAPKKTTTAKKPAPPKPSSLEQAITLINQERYKEAKPYLLNAINTDKNNPNVWYWYGVWHERLGCFHEAQYFYAKALKIDPGFDPLSRVVYYPEDPEKTPLWDPKRPARVYPVETTSRYYATVPAGSPESMKLPSAPDDPEIPHVPVYTPPNPGSSPLDGDEWSPSVYVPPSPNDPRVPEGAEPVYIPPQGDVIRGEQAEAREVLEFPMMNTGGDYAERDRIIRADLPLYTPPEPGQRVTPPPQPEQPKAKAQAPAKTQTRTQASLPTSRVVRQTKSTKTTAKTPAKTQTPARTQTQTRTRTQTQTRTPARPSSPDVRPQTPAQPRTTTPAPRQQTQTPPPPPVQIQPEETQPSRPAREFMPPVGQYAPDPGTIQEEPIPPVGQGNQD